MPSLIIPTLNAGADFRMLLKALREQEDAPSEIIVADSGSTDNTTAIASDFGCRILRISDFDHAKTRTHAALLARGDIVVFITQDVLPTSGDWLGALVKPILDGKAVATFGRQVARPTGPAIEKASRAFNYPLTDRDVNLADVHSGGFRSLFFSNANSAISKNVFVCLDGFSDPCLFGEDVDFAFRVLTTGNTIRYVSSASVWHTHDYTALQVLRRYFDIGVVHSLHPEWFEYGNSVTSSGLKLARAVLSLIFQEGRYSEMPQALLHMAARFFGYKLGRSHAYLTPGITKKMTMNRAYWDKISTAANNE